MAPCDFRIINGNNKTCPVCCDMQKNNYHALIKLNSGLYTNTQNTSICRRIKRFVGPNGGNGFSKYSISFWTFQSWPVDGNVGQLAQIWGPLLEKFWSRENRLKI